MPPATSRARGAWAVIASRLVIWGLEPSGCVSTTSTSLRSSSVTKPRVGLAKAMETGASVVGAPLASRSWMVSTTSMRCRSMTLIVPEMLLATQNWLLPGRWAIDTGS